MKEIQKDFAAPRDLRSSCSIVLSDEDLRDVSSKDGVLSFAQLQRIIRPVKAHKLTSRGVHSFMEIIVKCIDKIPLLDMRIDEAKSECRIANDKLKDLQKAKRQIQDYHSSIMGRIQ